MLHSYNQYRENNASENEIEAAIIALFAAFNAIYKDIVHASHVCSIGVLSLFGYECVINKINENEEILLCKNRP